MEEKQIIQLERREDGLYKKYIGYEKLTDEEAIRAKNRFKELKNREEDLSIELERIRDEISKLDVFDGNHESEDDSSQEEDENN